MGSDALRKRLHPLRIAIHVEGAAVSGNERQALLVAGELARSGHTVMASCRAGGPVEAAFRAEGIATTGIRPRGDADAWNALRFAWWLRRERVDAVLLTSWKRAFVAAWSARRAGVGRIVLRVGGMHRMSGFDGWKHRAALGRWTDAVVANSRAVAKKLRSQLPALAEDAVYVVPNGVRLAPAAPAPLREELRLPPDALLAVGVGALTPRKRFDLLLDALARAGDPGMHLAIAGEGPERERLLSVARALGLSDRVHLLGRRDDVAGVLAAADLFVLSSRAEGMSVAMLEAMTARRPVVATDVGGVWEALAARHGRPPAGWIVPREDPARLADGIAQVARALRTAPGEVRARVDEAVWRLEHWFTVEEMVRGVEAALLGMPWEPFAAEGAGG